MDGFPHHQMFSTEDDPEGEEHGIEDSLTNISKQQHPRPVEPDGEPLHWEVDEGHGDAQRKDHPLHRQPSSTQASNPSSPIIIIINIIINSVFFNHH